MKTTTREVLADNLELLASCARKRFAWSGADSVNDLMHETVRTCLEVGYPTHYNPQAWVALMTRRVAGEMRRERLTAKRRAMYAIACDPQTYGMQGIADHRPDPLEVQEAETEQAAEMTLVRFAMRTLPPAMRTNVTRRFGLDDKGERPWGQVSPHRVSKTAEHSSVRQGLERLQMAVSAFVEV